MDKESLLIINEFFRRERLRAKEKRQSRVKRQQRKLKIRKKKLAQRER